VVDKAMKKRDEGKVSLVEFLRSIKFAHENSSTQADHKDCPTHFAHFEQSARGGSESCAEDLQLIRSAN
jgi:hypothetical protein